jgi:phosphate uptake regulator
LDGFVSRKVQPIGLEAKEVGSKSEEVTPAAIELDSIEDDFETMIYYMVEMLWTCTRCLSFRHHTFNYSGD